MHALKRLCDGIEKTLNAVIVCLLALMTAAIFYQVILRYVFQSANIWAEEFARYAFIWVVLLGSAGALRRFQHIRIDFLIEALPPGIQHCVNLVNHVLMAVFLVVLGMYGLDIASRTGNQISAGMGIPMSYMYMSIPIGSGFMLLFLLEILLTKYLSAGNGKKTGNGGA